MAGNLVFGPKLFLRNAAKSIPIKDGSSLRIREPRSAGSVSSPALLATLVHHIGNIVLLCTYKQVAWIDTSWIVAAMANVPIDGPLICSQPQ